MFQFNEPTVIEIKEQYTKSTGPWYLGYSGGKDSSALIKLLFLSLAEMRHPSKTVTLIYCDTGVEIPIVSAFAHKTLKGIKIEAQGLDLPIDIKIASPDLHDRFFVKVIGRGYATPTNKFRWCTNRLRINPEKRCLIQYQAVRESFSLELEEVKVKQEI